MSVKVQKGTKVKLRFSDKTTLEYTTTQDLELEYVLGEVERLARSLDPENRSQDSEDGR